MRSLLVWLGVSALAGTGYGVGRTFAEQPGAARWLAAATAVATLASLAVIGLAMAAALKGQGRRLLVVAGLGLALVRGLLVGSRPLNELPRVAQRGQPPVLTELTATKPSWPGPRCVVEVVDQAAEGERRFRVTLPNSGCPLGPGDRISVLSSSLSLGLARRGSRGPVHVHGPVWLRERADSPFATAGRAAAAVRQAAWDASRGDPGRGFVAASTIGLVVALPPAERERLRRAGLGHLIAISGLHVGLAAMLILRSLGRLFAGFRWGPRASVLLTWVPVILYVWLTGGGAPAVRAAVMLLVVSIGDLVGRPTHGLTTVAVAAALMLLYAPGSCADPGFQMSMLAMAVLVRTPRDSGLLAVSWRLSWAVMPVAWFHFGRVDGYGLFANAVAVPVFIGWVVPTSVLGLVLYPWLGSWCFWPGAAGAELILAVAAWVSGWPVAPAWIWTLGAVLALLCHWRRPLGRIGRLLPPRIGCVGMVVVFIARGVSSPAPHARGWLAEGSVLRPTVVVFAGSKVCLRDPGGAAGRWRGRIEGFGAQRFSVEASHGIADAPELAAVRRAVAGAVTEELGDCSFPDRSEVLPALRRCRARGGTKIRRLAGEGLQCQVFSGWSTLRLDSNSGTED